MAGSTALWGIAIYGIGCIIPAPITQEGVPPASPPAIVSSSVIPPFGLLSRQRGDREDIRFEVTDPNLRDAEERMTAALYRRLPDGKAKPFLGDPILLTEEATATLDGGAEGAALVKRFRGTFPRVNLCDDIGEGTLNLIVADRDLVFADEMTDPAKLPKTVGLADEGNWVITCAGL